MTPSHELWDEKIFTNKLSLREMRRRAGPPQICAVGRQRFFARGKLRGLEPREAVYFSLTRLKSSRGRRYAHPVALNMTACSKPSEKFTSWSISNAFNLFLGFRANKYHWNEYKESGPFLGEADLLVSKANLNFNQNSTSFFKKIFYWTKLIGKEAVSYYVWRKFASQTLASYDLPFFISDVCFIICFRYCCTHSNVLVMQSFTVLQFLKYIKEVSRVLLLERFSVLRR